METAANSYWITRFAILRLLGGVYLMAFLVFLFQGPALIGHDGLLPADDFLDRVRAGTGSSWNGFWLLPSLFWLGISDHALAFVGWLGAAISLLALLGFSNALSWVVLWALYMSVAHVGQTFWGFGWENQLLETGVLAAFLCPLLDARPFPDRAPPLQVIWLFRWLTFRIMLGSALIKLRGDPCWRDLTCLDFHFETQPIPSPLTPLFHFLPHWVHAFGVQFNFVAELIAPFFVFGPKHARRVAGLIVIAFQLTLISSGNLSFLNWLTLIPALACLDDGLWGRVVPPRLRLRAHKAAITAEPSRAQTLVAWAFAAVIGVLSIEPVLNLLSPHQVMNTGHDPFELVNSYGAFGTVGKERDELVFEGTRDEDPEHATWLPYEFKCKPGDPARRPCWMSPYHYRLDWQVWFAAMSTPDDEPWTVHLIWKLLHNDPLALGLIAGNPFPDKPPTFIRVRRFRYRLLPWSAKDWWEREELGPWLPPLSAKDPELQSALDAYGWR